MLLGALLALTLSTDRLAAQIVVVVPSSSHVDSLSTTELRKIFMGQRIGKPKETPFQILEFGPVVEVFYKKLYGLGSYAIAKHWLRLIFSGEKVLPPRHFTSSKKFVQYLLRRDNAIGFLPADVFRTIKTDSIRAVTIDGRSFLHPQYALSQTSKKK